jgi:hypothetical protein
MPNITEQRPTISPGNPCPMLRALVNGGHVPDPGTSLKRIGSIAARLSGTATKPNRVTGVLTMLVAAIANGLNPLTIIRNLLRGIRFDQLRDGPLDKHGVGSGVLDAQGKVSATNLERLGTFASDKTDLSGTIESGLSEHEIVAMMDANLARAGRRARAIDRRLMDAEFPILLKMIGKDGTAGRYLSLAELRTLIIDERLPVRVTAQLGQAGRS